MQNSVAMLSLVAMYSLRQHKTSEQHITAQYSNYNMQNTVAMLSLVAMYGNIQIICGIYVKDTSDKGGWAGYPALVDSIECN